MENHKLVLPEHLNHFGFLFGGHMLMWIDEVAWIAACLDYPGYLFVTVGMDKVEFHKGVRQGAILKFDAQRIREGITSVTYEVNVTKVSVETADRDPVFSTRVSLVRVDETGRKTPLDFSPPLASDSGS